MHPLHQFSLIRFSGQNARQFLQGQLSNDLTVLSRSQSLLASCNSAQGRVQAILRLLELNGDILGLLPRSIITPTLTRLRKYVLRANVIIEDASDLMRIDWTSADELKTSQLPTPKTLGEYSQHQGCIVLRWPDSTTERFMIIQPGAATTVDAQTENKWQLADIRAGLPQVFSETYEEFVAQMLNLDVLGGISFNKGCYTGQEIIARAHFRGSVKRRMFRFSAESPAPIAGTKITVDGEPAGEVVMTAQIGSGCELLAVISLNYTQSALSLADTNTALQMLPLPYTVPTQS